MMINYDTILETIESQFKNILYGDNYYNGYSVTIAKEQDFVKIRDNKDPKHIYIIVKFQSASLNYHQYLLPLTITALSEQNKLDVCQRLLLEYAETYNLSMSNDETIKQFYDAPQVLSNFEEIYYGYRSMLHMGGTFLVSQDSNPMRFYYYTADVDEASKEKGVTIDADTFFTFLKTNNFKFNLGNTANAFAGIDDNGIGKFSSGGSKGDFHASELGISYDENPSRIGIIIKQNMIDCLNYQSSGDIVLDTQPFYNTDNFAKSIGKVANYTIAFTSYLVNDPFLNKAVAIHIGDLNYAPKGINSTFWIEIEYQKSGLSSIRPFKLVNCAQSGALGEFPVINVVFSL